MNITGRLTRDAEISILNNDRQVVNFSIAVNDSYRNKQGEHVELTEYFNCAYWLSPRVAPILTNGTVVELTGRVSARVWLRSDGEVHAGLNFHTSRIKFFGSGRRMARIENRSGSTAKIPTNNSKSNPTAQDGDDLPF